MRQATIKRETKETQIEISLNLDEQSGIEIDTGIGFLNHMLNLFAKHGRFGLVVKCHGDLDGDPHHTTEDTGIVLGECFKQALGDKQGIERSYLVFDAELTNPRLGGLDTETVEDFFQAVAFAAEMNLHARILYGRNTHHKVESLFKAFGRAMRAAVTINPDIQGVNSTKGVI